MEQQRSGAPLNNHHTLMRVTVLTRRTKWNFSKNPRRKGLECNKIWMGTPLKLDVIGRSTSEFEPKQEWDKIDNERSKVMLELYLAFSME